MTSEFVAVHNAMSLWCDRQSRNGWPSPEVERAALRVLQGLWVCGNNDPTAPGYPGFLTTLARDTEALTRAREGGSNERSC